MTKKTEENPLFLFFAKTSEAVFERLFDSMVCNNHR